MTILSPQHKRNIFHTAAARAVHLKVKSDPDTPCLNPSCGLLGFALGARIGLNLQMKTKWPYQWGKEVMQRLGTCLGQVNHGIWASWKRRMGDHLPTWSFLLVKRMDCGLASLYLSQSSICKLSSFPFQEGKVTELYLAIPRNTGRGRSSISPWILFLIASESITPTQAISQSDLIWDITRPTGWLQGDFWQERDWKRPGFLPNSVLVKNQSAHSDQAYKIVCNKCFLKISGKFFHLYMLRF